MINFIRQFKFKKRKNSLKCSVKGFTIIELLVVIAIIGILVGLTTLTGGSLQRRGRDTERKTDLHTMLLGLDSFRSDFKIYPNYTFIIGARDNSSDYYGVKSEVERCTVSNHFSHRDNFVLNPNDLNNSLIKEGFQSVNSFLGCLGYLEAELNDPQLARDSLNNYHYRVSYDYSQILLKAVLENTNDSKIETLSFGIQNNVESGYFLGNGKTYPHFKLQSLQSNKYPYQCRNNLSLPPDNNCPNIPNNNRIHYAASNSFVELEVSDEKFE